MREKEKKLNEKLPLISLLLGCVFWGLSWLPLKYFADAGLTGNWVGMTAYGLVGLVAIPIVIKQRKLWQGEGALLWLIGLFFGFANIAFSTALMQGEVVRVMLLFYLLPAWGAMGGVFFLKEQLGVRRKIAIFLSLSGVFVIMGGTAVFEHPLSMVDFLALAAGFCLSAAGVVNKKAQKIPMASRAFVPFIFCPMLAAVAHSVVPATMPDMAPTIWVLLALFAFVWLFGATLLTTYGVAHIEASQASILQVTELFVAILSAIYIGGEILTLKEILGGAMIVIAAVMESLPSSD